MTHPAHHHRAAARLVLATLPAALAAPAHAAGGHHGVDDAALLEPGQCQFETWVDRARAQRYTLLHAGPACRVGAVELGLSIDRSRAGADERTTALGLQLKWAGAVLGDDLRAGIVLAATRQQQAPHFAGGQVVLPLTWQVGPALQLHASVGRDLLRGERDQTRGGLAAEWAPSPAWSFVAERLRESGAHFGRAAVRYAPGPALSIDLGRTRGLHEAASWWTLGLNWVFDR